MSRKIDIELTSERADGTWTWRAAGAKQPKGALDGSVLPSGLSIGDIVKAEADFGMDGIDILSVQAPKDGGRKEAETIEVVGPARKFEPVIHKVSKRHLDDADGKKGKRRGGRGRDDGPSRGGKGGERGGGRGGQGRGDGRGDSKRDGGRGGNRSGPGRPPQDDSPSRPRPKRIRPGRTHRNAMLAELPEEQRPVAEQLMRGGLPAVRQAIAAQNEKAKTDGTPPVPEKPLLDMAEKLQRTVRAAEWMDKAQAAKADVDEIDLRDLRSVVVAADDVARAEDEKALAAELRGALEARVERDHSNWLDELAELIGDSRVVRALKHASRPVKAGSPLPRDMQAKLVAQVREQFGPEVSQHRWAIVIDALAYSPVRSSVIPETVPDNPSEELLETIKKHAGRLPELAAKFGVTEATRPKRSRAGKPKGATPPVPPPPPVAATPAPVAHAAPTPAEAEAPAPSDAPAPAANEASESAS